jgi:hypothetical protein
MTRSNFSEYEKRRAENHELEWRLACLSANIHSHHCHLRLCRRLQACSGPMLPSDHQRGQIRAQQEIGLTGRACATLPLCMKNATAERYAIVRGASEQLTELRSKDFKGDTPTDTLNRIRHLLRNYHRRKHPSPPLRNHP